MSCPITQSFTIDCRDSIGGVREIKVKVFDSALTGITVTSGVATLAGAGLTGWFKYVCEDETAMNQDEGATDRQAGTTVFTQTIKYINNKLKASFRNELASLHQATVWVAVYDNNGNSWLYGYQRGMFVSASSSSSGTKLSDRSGYEVTFSGKEPQLAVSISNNWTALVSS